MSMMVLMISLTPSLALRTPAMAAHSPPPIMPAMKHRGMSTGLGRPPIYTPTMVAIRPPMMIWPSDPREVRPVR